MLGFSPTDRGKRAEGVDITFAEIMLLRLSGLQRKHIQQKRLYFSVSVHTVHILQKCTFYRWAHMYNNARDLASTFQNPPKTCRRINVFPIGDCVHGDVWMCMHRVIEKDVHRS